MDQQPWAEGEGSLAALEGGPPGTPSLVHHAQSITTTIKAEALVACDSRH